MFGRLIIDLILVVNDVLTVLSLFYWILIMTMTLWLMILLVVRTLIKHAWLICASWIVGYACIPSLC